MIRKRYRWICVVSLLVVHGIATAQTTNTLGQSDQPACTALAHVKNAQWAINSSELVRPLFTVGDGSATATVSEVFCRVSGQARPVPGSEIGFEVWLPAKARWNGKFAGVGGGGSQGIIEYAALSQELARGYATVATDNGHRSKGFDVSWALQHPERIVDFGYRAQHAATEAGKALTQEFYGTKPKHSYFIGCSQGGHHGFTEAQRFPEDYDGIVAGAPVYSWTGEMTGQAWNVRALQQTPHGALGEKKLDALYAAVTKACAGTDGLIDDPRKCSFDPATIQCKAADNDMCLTTQEVVAVRALYAGPKTSAGKQLYPGLSRGSEYDWYVLWSDTKHLGGSWEGFYQSMVFGDPNWNLSTMNFDRDAAYAKKKLGMILNPDNPNLKAFADHGGKLIVYHGWADDMVPSQVSINYWNSVIGMMGPSRTNEFYRLFMVPGMAHCTGGVGADVLFHSEDAAAVPLEPERDMLTALEKWVEQGKAPSNFIASRVNEKNGSVERTRLLCAYPNTAKYRGKGDAMQAENFTCSTK